MKRSVYVSSLTQRSLWEVGSDNAFKKNPQNQKHPTDQTHSNRKDAAKILQIFCNSLIEKTFLNMY